MIKEEWNKDEIEKYNFKRKLIQNKKCFEKKRKWETKAEEGEKQKEFC